MEIRAEWVNRQDRVTIRHLLAHTAGLRDAFLLIELAAPAAPGVDINEHILRTLAGQRGLNFVPATEFSYNNGGYNVLGRVVSRERTALPRVRFCAYLQSLGMTQSSFEGARSRSRPIMPADTTATTRDFISPVTRASIPRRLSATSGCSRRSGTCCGSRRTLAMRVGSRSSQRDANGGVARRERHSPWGLGLEVGVDGGLKTVGHGGGDRGIAAYLIRYPAHDLNVAVLCNLDNLNARVGTLTRQVAALYLPERPQPEAVMLLRSRLDPHLRLPSSRATPAYRDPATDTYGRSTCGMASCGRRWMQATALATALNCAPLPRTASRFLERRSWRSSWHQLRDGRARSASRGRDRSRWCRSRWSKVLRRRRRNCGIRRRLRQRRSRGYS